MGPAVAGVLAVDEREVRFAIADRVGKGKLEVLRFVIKRFIQSRLADFAGEEVQQSVSGYKALLVENQRKPAVQAGVVPHPLFDIVEIEREVFSENLYIRQKLEIGSVGFAGLPTLLFPFETPSFKMRCEVISVTKGNRPEI